MKKRRNDLLEIVTTQTLPEDLQAREHETPPPNKAAILFLKILGVAMTVYATSFFFKVLAKCVNHHQLFFTCWFFGILLFLVFGIVISTADKMNL
ncbi:MAG: hypothetical protein DRO96_01560 [Candidatus Aenigmatarchaeota archaeon]|nr:MAG: hypothetical protein DRO96_01560 [Candidatus Aenigmarchaeota archaeon]